MHTGMIDECFLTKEINEEGKYLVQLFDLPSKVFACADVCASAKTHTQQHRL